MCGKGGFIPSVPAPNTLGLYPVPLLLFVDAIRGRSLLVCVPLLSSSAFLLRSPSFSWDIRDTTVLCVADKFIKEDRGGGRGKKRNVTQLEQERQFSQAKVHYFALPISKATDNAKAGGQSSY